MTGVLNKTDIRDVVENAADRIIEERVRGEIAFLNESMVPGGEIFEEVKKVYLAEAERWGINANNTKKLADGHTAAVINSVLTRLLRKAFGG
ncbi:hypothetical protein [Shimazuella alba]|uniref:Uncharacterized protein n=1 Tax=Shimazuella alba TaxID=2690964 RepID=A0A6I4VVB0_9BACL|nr:hypothetical protein [Shimazuella alba]MXQ55819.1 hypothetical protein [Shimazuella alba]